MRLLHVAVAVAACVHLAAGTAGAADKLAEKFGAMPSLWGVQLSPSGSKLSYLQMHESGVPIAVVLELGNNAALHVAVASDPERFDVVWCDWANDERLICATRGVADAPMGGMKFYATRLMAVNYDGSKPKFFFEDEVRENAFFRPPTDIVDWLPGEPDHVLMPHMGDRGQGLARVHIGRGTGLPSEAAITGAFSFVSAGDGFSRLYNEVTRDESIWHYRNSKDGDWKELHRSRTEDYEVYTPLGFGADGRTLYIQKMQDGRSAVFARDLEGDNVETLVYANPHVGVGQAITLGPDRHVAGVTYRTDTIHRVYFDPAAQDIIDRVKANFPGKETSIVSLSHNNRLAVVHVGSADDPGAYYLMDVEKNAMGKFRDIMPQLADVATATTRDLPVTTRDGATIGASLTLPTGQTGNLPAIVLAHGSAQPTGHGGFDYLTHYLAAKGYAVLRTYYRGADDYMRDWAAGANFQNWQRTADDLQDAARALAEAGIARDGEICAAGWGLGGYAALIAAAEHHDTFACVAAIAPVTNTVRVVGEARRMFSGRDSEFYIPLDDEKLVQSSPDNRADDFTQPVLLIQGKEDVFVDYRQNQNFESRLNKAGNDSEFVYIEDADGLFERGALRSELLTEIGDFVEANIDG